MSNAPIRLRFAFLLSAVLLRSPAAAQGDPGRPWVLRGPEGGWISTLATNGTAPAVVLASARALGGYDASTVARSEDGGRSWELLGVRGLSSAAFAPSDPRVAYLSTSAGFLASADAGRSFQPRTAPTSDSGSPASGSFMRVDPMDPGTVYLGGLQLFKTQDGGRTWTIVRIPAHVGIGDLEVTALLIDPADTDVLLALTLVSGLFRSTDGGATWQPWGTLPPSAVSPSLERDPSTGAIWVGAWASTDGGASFHDESAGIASGDLIGALQFERSGTMFAFGISPPYTVYRRSPGEARWTALDLRRPDSCLPVQAESILAPEPNGHTILIGTYQGLLISENDGNTFEVAGGLGKLAGRVLVDPWHPGTVLLDDPYIHYLFRSPDRGRTWRGVQPADTSPGACAAPELAAPAPSVQGLLYAFQQIPFASEEHRLICSLDEGRTWEAVGDGAFINPVALAVNPVDANELFVITLGFTGSAVRSAAGVSAPATLPVGVLHSTDAGQSFMAEPLPSPPSEGQEVVFDPRDSSTVYALDRDLYRRRGPSPWERLPLYPTTEHPDLPAHLAVDASTGTIFVATTEPALLHSTDEGRTWSRSDQGLPAPPAGASPARFPITGVVVDPVQAGTAFVGLGDVQVFNFPGTTQTVRGGVFGTSDGGLHWARAAEGLSGGVSQLAIDPRLPTLYASSTFGLEVLDLTIPLRLDAISPASGSVQGGTLVTLTGDGLAPDSTVVIGGAATSEFTFFSPQVIRVRTGPAPVGAADLVVTNADGSVSRLSRAFTYVDWSCSPDASALCLENGRFRVTATSATGAAHPEPLTLKSGYFWFDWNQNPRVVVKILDNRGVDGHYWIHLAGLTDDAFTVRVTDTASGRSRDYVNPKGTAAASIDRTTF